MMSSELQSKMNERLSKEKAGAFDCWLRFKDVRPAAGWVAVLKADGIPGLACIYHVINGRLHDYEMDAFYLPNPMDIWTPVPEPPKIYLTWKRIADESKEAGDGPT